MAYEIVLLPSARQQLGRAAAWWRDQRPAAPDLLMLEIERAFANLAAFPRIGRVAREDHSLRLLVLPKTATKLLYRILPQRQQIEIVLIAAARAP